MPVILTSPRSESTTPAPPKLIVWLVVFTVVMLVGVVSTLLSWPKAEPTSTAWFWVRLLVFPALAWCILFGLRLHYYNEETDRQQAEDEVWAEDRAESIRFASEPLAVLGHAYLCALNSADAAQGQTKLSAQGAPLSEGAIRHTTLSLADDEGSVGRYRSSFMELLGPMADAISVLPRSVPFDIRLQLPVEADPALLFNTWQECWRECDFRPAETSLLAAGKGLMVLDEWLDICGGPELEKITLYVAVQLHDKPPAGSAEAAVALLLGWAPLTARKGLPALALLHRPVETDLAVLNDAAALSLLWGNTEAAQVSDLWQAGLSKADKPALVKASSDLALGISQTDDLSGIHDIDVAIGNAGVAASWLALAMAVEHATTTGKAQWIACRENTLRLAIAQPASQDDNVEQKG